MDWRIFAATFAVVFLSELSDKTWLAIITTSAASRAPGAVLVGALLALACSTLAAVALGRWVGVMLPASTLRVVVGVSFLLCGLWFLLKP